MELYILDSNYEQLGIIDEAESVLWLKNYNDAGECEIYAPCNADYLALLKSGHYVYRYDDDMFCKITTFNIETDTEMGDYIIAKGVDVCQILAGRIVRWNISYRGKLTGFIEKVLNDNAINPAEATRRIPNFEIDKSNFSALSATVDRNAFTDDLLSVVMATCKAHNYGFRVSYDINTRKLVFRLYEGVNKATQQGAEYIEFSPEYANILSSSYTEDESNYKNVVYVSYIGYDEKTYLLSLHNATTEPQGEERREVFIDGTSITRDLTLEELRQMFPDYNKSSEVVEDETHTRYYTMINGVEVTVATSVTTGNAEIGYTETITASDYTYLLLIRSLGETAFADWQRSQSFTGVVDTINTYEYKTDYDIGDIVKVINEYGIEAEARITGIMESDDINNGYIAEPTYEYIN